MHRRSLLHNPSNPVTQGIWREDGARGAVVRKRIRGDGPATHPDWVSSTDPQHWLYWRREACVLEAGLQNVYAAEGLRGPERVAVEERPDGSIDLVMGVVSGRTGPQLVPDDLVEVAGLLGRAQGRLTDERPEHPWLSRGFLADHIASKQVRYGALQDGACWSHPLIRSTWPASLRPGLLRLVDRRRELLDVAAAAPRTLCHLDFWSHNLFRSEQGWTAIDWACCGDGALGEDISNLVIEAVLDGFVAPEQLGELGERALNAYCEGVAASGWSGPLDPVRQGFLAAAVKWCWLGPLHLERARTGGHHVYGGDDDPHPIEQYRTRGLALAQIVSWADEVLTFR